MDVRGLFKAHRARILFLFRYGISGVVGGAIQTLFLFFWVSVLGLERTYLFGLGLGFVLALAVNFVLQKYWAFRDNERNRTSRQLLSYTVVALSGLALNALLLAGAKGVFELYSFDFFSGWYLLAQIAIVGIVAIFNFSMNFLFTFRRARQERLWERSRPV